MKVIGLSMSFCVRDIIKGKVKIENVVFISAATKARTEADWESVFAAYKQWYWKENPEEGERIARQLISDGLIIQPRLENNNPVRYHGEPWVEPSIYNEMYKESQKEI
jgi:hypothetical protein